MQINLPSIFSALSLCSPALSLPLQARNASLTLTIHTAVVIDFKSSVLADLTNIDVTSSIIPTVKTNLKGIVVAVEKAVAVLGPVLVGSAVQLVAVEGEQIVTDLATLKTDVGDVVQTVEYTLVSVLADTFALVKPEVEQVLKVVLPLLGPVIVFVENVVGDIASANGIAGELKTLSSQIEGILDGTVKVVANTTS